ncbi:hypothetical protein LY76DRAFT_589011 [Colletotrichum caudatum]|nr:hypothetical protein LY76DRAFT_589011 [Colletotrichum caudatum]
MQRCYQYDIAGERRQRDRGGGSSPVSLSFTYLSVLIVILSFHTYLPTNLLDT